ncbi:MAG: branched-chain amino acid ABC transporter permease [Burkholderiales bacterium]|nr:branched-chain amino acid ABC transporter permease [Burkholderiales bacterium]
MTGVLILEQALNGLQFGLMLFLLAAGLTLVFGIMDMINLAHGSLYMVGAYLVAAATAASGSFWLGLAAGVAGAASLAGPVELLPGFYYPAYRLLIIGVGLAVALLLWLLITRTRLGMQVRAGASNREMALVMGTNVRVLFTALFGLGAALCAVAGGMLGPLLAVQVGMGESILILAFVVIVIGGIGSVRGALLGALLVGVVDTAGRTLIPMAFDALLGAEAASNAGPAVASILIYVLMAAVLFWKPKGLFPSHG